MFLTLLKSAVSGGQGPGVGGASSMAGWQIVVVVSTSS